MLIIECTIHQFDVSSRDMKLYGEVLCQDSGCSKAVLLHLKSMGIESGSDRFMSQSCNRTQHV